MLRKAIFLTCAIFSFCALAERSIGISVDNEKPQQNAEPVPAPVTPAPLPGTEVKTPAKDPVTEIVVKELSEKNKDFLGYLFYGTPVKSSWEKYFYDQEELDFSQVPGLLRDWTQQKDVNTQNFKRELSANPQALEKALSDLLQVNRLQNSRGEAPKMDFVARELISAFQKEAPSQEAAAPRSKGRKKVELPESDVIADKAAVSEMEAQLKKDLEEEAKKAPVANDDKKPDETTAQPEPKKRKNRDLADSKDAIPLPVTQPLRSGEDLVNDDDEDEEVVSPPLIEVPKVETPPKK